MKLVRIAVAIAGYPAIFLLGTVAGCGSMRQGESTSRCTDCATALYRDSGSGGTIYSVASAGEDAVGRVAHRYCIEHGLEQPTIGSRTASPLGSGFWNYDFSCAGATPAPQQPSGGDTEKFGTTCTSIGFQKGTPDYGNCVLKLMEMNSAQADANARPSPQQLLRQQQREHATRVIRQGLDGLSDEPLPGCEAAATMTIKLPCGDIVSCTKKGDQVSCD